MYELGGVCNDGNCPYQHQRDFEDASDVEDSGDDEDANMSGLPCLSREQLGLLQDFVDLRSKVSRKWPVITGRGLPPVPTAVRRRSLCRSMRSWVVLLTVRDGALFAQLPPVVLVDANRGDLGDSGHNSTGARQEIVKSGEAEANDSTGDFLQLEDYDETRVGSAAEGGAGSRYCQSGDTVDASKRVLGARIARRPEDTDAWLLLAVHQLDFEVKLRQVCLHTFQSLLPPARLTLVRRLLLCVL